MTANRFEKSWMRRMVDAVRADPEGWMMAGRSIGWTDTYNRVADQTAVDAYLESGRAGIAAYAALDQRAACVDWMGYWATAHALGFFTPPASPGRQRLITLAVRHCWRKP